jgi:hypothetical protein
MKFLIMQCSPAFSQLLLSSPLLSQVQTVYSAVKPHSLVEDFRRFGEKYCLRLQG